MECTCGSEEKYRRRYISLRKKYEHARKQHKKLLGVAMELTQVLEEYVRGDRTPNVTETLVLCANIYPTLFHELNSRTKELQMETANRDTSNETVVETKAENDEERRIEEEIPENETGDKTMEVEEEYSEGFMSRPKLPRTPLNSNTN